MATQPQNRADNAPGIPNYVMDAGGMRQGYSGYAEVDSSTARKQAKGTIYELITTLFAESAKEAAASGAGRLGGRLLDDVYCPPRTASEARRAGLTVKRAVDLGIHRNPRHHIFPQELRDFFRKRNFEDIDNYTIPLDRATHDAIHKWMGPGSWNETIKSRMLNEEAKLKRLLTRTEIMRIGARMRREAGLSNIKVVPYQD